MQKEKPKVAYSVALAMAFLVAENENQLLEDLPQANVGLVPERFLLLVRTKSITENFVCWKLHPLFVLEVCQCILFIMSFSTNTLFIFGDFRCFYFHSLIKLTFLVSKGLLCLYDKQNNTWLLVNWYEMLSSHLQLDISLVHCTHSWAIKLNTWREIPYLCVSMYYSLYLFYIYQYIM